jgi:hypothetical protein
VALRPLQTPTQGATEIAMAPPSLSSFELEVLIYGTAVLVFFGSFLVLIFSAIFGLGLARLLYVTGAGARGKSTTHTYSTARERCMPSVESCRVTEAEILTIIATSMALVR